VRNRLYIPVVKLSIVALFAACSLAQAEVAISIRYFKDAGTSHYHLFLYSDNGQLIRQLTASDDAQDTAPMFSSDGQKIYFTRQQAGT